METVKRGRGRPKGSKKVKSPWFTFICPTCKAKYGALMASAEFSCYNTKECKGIVAVKKGK